MVSVVIRNGLVQLNTPDAMRGRVNAVESVFIGASNELGSFESGTLAQFLGPVAAVAIGAASRRSLAIAAEPLSSTIGEVLRPPRGAATEEELRLRIEGTRRHLDQTLSALEHKSDLVGPLRDTALGLGSLGIAVSSIVRSAGEQTRR